ncbi:unnamed protein product [Phytomonas sp. Hart1]|nr:unnamed protein product [Phytomonas sp. Hart1]|eukprot:CCW69711.1 unnamed protein product [Phytomonas sp. isolate Hart1]
MEELIEVLEAVAVHGARRRRGEAIRRLAAAFFYSSANPSGLLDVASSEPLSAANGGVGYLPPPAWLVEELPPFLSVDCTAESHSSPWPASSSLLGSSPPQTVTLSEFTEGNSTKKLPGNFKQTIRRSGDFLTMQEVRECLLNPLSSTQLADSALDFYRTHYTPEDMITDIFFHDPCFRSVKKTMQEVSFCRRVLMAYTRALVLSDPAPLLEQLVEVLLDLLFLPHENGTNSQSSLHCISSGSALHAYDNVDSYESACAQLVGGDHEGVDSMTASSWYLYSSFLQELLDYHQYSINASDSARMMRRRMTYDISGQCRSLLPETPRMAKVIYEVSVNLRCSAEVENDTFSNFALLSSSREDESNMYYTHFQQDRERWSRYLFLLSFQMWTRLGKLDIAAEAAYYFFKSQPNHVVHLIADVHDAEHVSESEWMDALSVVLCCAAAVFFGQNDYEILGFQAGGARGSEGFPEESLPVAAVASQVKIGVEKVRYFQVMEDFQTVEQRRTAQEFTAYYEQVQGAFFNYCGGGILREEYNRKILDPFKVLYDHLLSRLIQTSALEDVKRAGWDDFTGGMCII